MSTATEPAMHATMPAVDFFRVLFTDHALPKLIYDCKTLQFLEVNNAALNTYGYERNAMIGLSMLELHYPEHVPDILRLVRSSSKDERRHKTVHLTRTGEPLTVHIYSQSIDYEDRSARLVTVVDVTGHERAQHALADAETLLQAIIDNVPEPVFIKDLQGRYVFMNRAGAAGRGLTLEQVIGRTAEELTGPESDPFRAHDLEVHRTGQSSVRLTETIQGGEPRTLLMAKAPWTDANGNVRGVIGTARDVTEQQRATNALAVAERRYRGLFEHMTPGVVYMDGSGALTAANPAAQRILGVTMDEMRGGIVIRDGWRVLRPDGSDFPVAEFPGIVALRTGTEISDVVMRIFNPVTQEERWIVVAAVPEFDDESGRPTSVFTTLHDITQLRHAEHALRDSEAQFRQAQKMEAVGRLAGGVAHDFNNILTAITGHAELLSEMFSPHDPRMEDVAEIRRAAERATALTRQLLAFSRRQVLQPEVLDMRTVVMDMERMLHRLIGEDVHLEVNFDRGGVVPAVNADRTQIEQVVMNLAVNARDAMPGGGTLRIGVDLQDVPANDVHAAGRYVRLGVADTGEGIPPELLANIFEPFFTTKDSSRGTGLGLSTVYGIVQQSAGFICVDSAIAQGTTFEIMLPLVGTAPEIVVAEKQSTGPLHGNETILLVEDDVAVRGMAARVLNRQGYRVLSAGSGAEALDIARATPSGIHLVVTDMVMPQMNGREFARLVADVHPGVRVVFMSGYTYDEFVQDGDAVVESCFLPKPFTPDGLARKIRDVLAA